MDNYQKYQAFQHFFF